MSVGIRTIYTKTANQLFTSNAVLATIGLVSPIAASQTQKIRVWVPFTVGATGGLQLQIVVPAGGVIFEGTINLYNPVTPSQITAEQQASAAFAAALAVAGDHWIIWEGQIVNGLTAGNVDVQMCQNTSDALSLTVKRAATMEVVTI